MDIDLPNGLLKEQNFLLAIANLTNTQWDKL